MDRAELQRGEAFADKLYALVHRLGPGDLDAHERDALASHLVATAVEWVKLRNRFAQAKAQSNG